MKSLLLGLLLLSMTPAPAIAADTATIKPPAKPETSKVDPALEAAHTKEDVRRHRIIAAAHEAAAKCQESGKDEQLCVPNWPKRARVSPTASTAA